MYSYHWVPALLLGCILLALAALHLYWMAGGEWGLAVVIPTTLEGKPVLRVTKLSALVVSMLLLLAAAIALVPFQLQLRNNLLRVMAVVFALRAVGDFRYAGFAKKVRGTAFAKWDSRLFSPLCLAMASLALAASLLGS